MNGASLVDASSVESLSVIENGVGLSSKAATSDVGVANSSLVKTALNASGSAPIYACRAWVNFNGTGTVAIGASGNVSSITDNGVGDYTVNFAAAMPDANYSANFGLSDISWGSVATILVMTSTSIKFRTLANNGTLIEDVQYVNVSIFR